MVLFVCFHFPPRNPPHKSRRVPPLCPFQLFAFTRPCNRSELRRIQWSKYKGGGSMDWTLLLGPQILWRSMKQCELFWLFYIFVYIYFTWFLIHISYLNKNYLNVTLWFWSRKFLSTGSLPISWPIPVYPMRGNSWSCKMYLNVQHVPVIQFFHSNFWRTHKNFTKNTKRKTVWTLVSLSLCDPPGLFLPKDGENAVLSSWWNHWEVMWRLSKRWSR